MVTLYFEVELNKDSLPGTLQNISAGVDTPETNNFQKPIINLLSVYEASSSRNGTFTSKRLTSVS